MKFKKTALGKFHKFIDCDNEFKILFIKWLFKMEFYHLKYFNRKHSVVTDGIMKLGGSNQVLCNMWFYNFQCHVVMPLINSSVRLQIFLSHTDSFCFLSKYSLGENIFMGIGWIFNNLTWNEPAHENGTYHVRTAKAQEPAHPLFAHMKYGSRRKIKTPSPTGWLCIRVWRMILWRTKSTI